MANLEGNLKKINEELEMLEDNELENVAGGVLPVWTLKGRTYHSTQEQPENNRAVQFGGNDFNEIRR